MKETKHYNLWKAFADGFLASTLISFCGTVGFGIIFASIFFAEKDTFTLFSVLSGVTVSYLLIEVLLRYLRRYSYYENSIKKDADGIIKLGLTVSFLSGMSFWTKLISVFFRML